MSQTAKLLVDSQCALGEGPFWHKHREKLFWFDINAQTLFAVDENGKDQESWSFDEIVTAAAIISKDELAIATETGLKRFNLVTREITLIAAIEADNPANRSNDCRSHPSGGYWIGTMVKDEGPAQGALYHFRKGKLTQIRSEAAIPNAACFTADGKRAYWTDTPTQKILTVETDPSTGLPTGEWEVFADVSNDRGYPDGAVVDSEGYIWNARWGGNCVIRYAPDGTIDRIIEVPVSQVTCSAFGGKDLKRLFITTANKNMSKEQLAEEKVAGGVFYIDLDVAGLPEPTIEL